MKQTVIVVDFVTAQNEINAMIDKGWTVKEFVLEPVHCSQGGASVRDITVRGRCIVLFERSE